MIHHLKNKMIRLGQSLPFIIFFAAVLMPCNSEACTLKIPRQSKFKISSTDQCRFSIENNKKYFDLAYYKATNQGFDNLIREGIDITASNGDFYLPMDFIDDANYSVTPIFINPLRRLLPNSKFLESNSLVYAISLPKQNFKHAASFSLKLNCIEIAGGDEKTSFTTRYCTPLSKNSDRELIAYRKFIEAIAIQNTL
ncbi:MAG: hypothetical protein JWQ41_2714 [Variovorax sp.]|nr:hypothetical protein [Variovorax sp.]